MSEFVTIRVERWFRDEASGDNVTLREVERAFGANRLDQLHDEALAVMLRELIGQTRVLDEWT